MKKIAFLLILILSIKCESPNRNPSNQQVLNKLETCVETSDYFELKNVFNNNIENLSETHQLYYNAIITNVFNQSKTSNLSIEELLLKHTSNLNESMRNKLYQAKLLNHLNLYEYREAAESSAYIQTNFAEFLDSVELENLRNEIKIWRALKEAPKQQIIKNTSATIPMVKDKVGLFNIDVTFGETTKNLLFDTGANFSVIIRSLALELGFKITEADFYVTAATGLKVPSDIAIAPELEISGITLKNVFFLVVDDKDLSFPQIDYYINGAIGFPVIEAMEEIRIRKNNQIFIPESPVQYSYNNLALNGLMPIIAAEFKGEVLRFNFDTGATTTSLYPKFFKIYQEEIEKKYDKIEFTSGSGGGLVQFEGYVIDDILLKVADSQATLDSVRLHIKDIGMEESHFHGNFGQDYIKQFDEMIISFKYASVLFN